MVATAPNTAPVTPPSSPDLTSRLVNGLLSIKPLATFMKSRARAMMVDRAEEIGVPWRQRVAELRSRQSAQDFDPTWDAELAVVTNPELVYPAYYTTSFHAYEEGNLGWLPAMEVEVASRAVHAKIWPEAGAEGDAWLRQSYHAVLTERLPEAPRQIADLGCGAGLSTVALQHTFPGATVTGVDLSPYFLAIARYRQGEENQRWVHAAAENTGLPAGSMDLVSACLMFHELPQTAAIAILHEARRLLKPGGHFTIMDMNPHSEVMQKLPPFVFTLLKSTEPYLDQYFGLDFATELQAAGFDAPQVQFNSPRHRTLITQVR